MLTPKLLLFSAGLIIAGYDHRKGGEIYNIPLGGSLHKAPYAIGGSGSTYIFGYCDSNWKDGMNEEEAVAFTKGALQQAIKWDGSSGGVIRMVVLTEVSKPLSFPELKSGLPTNSAITPLIGWCKENDFLP